MCLEKRFILGLLFLAQRDDGVACFVALLLMEGVRDGCKCESSMELGTRFWRWIWT